MGRQRGRGWCPPRGTPGGNDSLQLGRPQQIWGLPLGNAIRSWGNTTGIGWDHGKRCWNIES